MLVCPFCQYEIDEANDHFSGSNYQCRGDCKDLVIPMEINDKEVTTEEETKPDCFSYHDGRDPACRRCGLKKQCNAEFEATRPECFGTDKYGAPECAQCIDSSLCVEAKNLKENKKMARKRATRTTRRRRKPVEEPVVEEEVEEEEEGTDYTSMGVPALRKELKERGLDPNGRKSLLVKRLMADDEEGEEDEDVVEEEELEEEAPTPPVARRKRTRVKKTTKEEAAPEAEVADEVAPAEVSVQTDASPLSDLSAALLAGLQTGQTLTVLAIQDGYAISLGGVPTVAVSQAPIGGPVELAEAPAAPKKKGLRGKAFDREVFSEKYWEFKYEDCGVGDFTGTAWDGLSTEDKYDLAEEVGATWDDHDSERVDQMRMTVAVFGTLDIPKYKEKYQKKAARDALKA